MNIIEVLVILDIMHRKVTKLSRLRVHLGSYYCHMPIFHGELPLSFTGLSIIGTDDGTLKTISLMIARKNESAIGDSCLKHASAWFVLYSFLVFFS